MHIIKIEQNPNGSHVSQITSLNLKQVMDGWAVVNDDIELPSSFPFVDIEVETIDEIPTVVSMTPREVPKAESIPEPEFKPSLAEQNRADIDYIALLSGIQL